MKALHIVAFILLVIGGLVWLLVGLGAGNVVETVLGAGTAAKAVYVLVGLAALAEVVTHKKNCKACGGSAM